MTWRPRPLALAPALALAAGVTVAAHHSLVGIYDTARQTSIEAVVTAFHFVNPHPYLLVAVTREGRATEWRLDLDNRRELVQAGMTEETLRPGDRLTVTGNPGRPPQPQSLYVRTLERPADGFAYDQAGFTPTIRTR